MAMFFRLETEIKHYLVKKIVNPNDRRRYTIMYIVNEFKMTNTICEKKSGLPTASTKPLSYQSTDRIKAGIWKIIIQCIFVVTIMPME